MHNPYFFKNDLSASCYKNRKETIFSKITLFDPDIMIQHLSPRLPTGAIYFYFSNNFKYLDFLTGLEKTKRKTHPTKGETKTRLKF